MFTIYILFFAIKIFSFLFLSFPEFNKVKIISDSIAKHVWGIDGVVVQALCGDTIDQIANKVECGIASLRDFDYVIFHVGTNDIDNKASFHALQSDYGNLVGICRRKYPKLGRHYYSLLSIPCPRDHANTDDHIKRNLISSHG